MAQMITDELLDRLSTFEPNGFPVLSLYLNTQPDQHGRDNFHAYVQKEFRVRAKTFAPQSSERESYDADTARIRAYLENELSPSANGLVIFACSAADLFEAAQLEVPVPDHRFYIYDQPHLYTLALLNDEYRRYAAVVANSASARIFVFGLGQTLHKQEVTGTKTHRVKVGGWSQARYQRRVDNSHAQHAKEVAEVLDQIVREDRILHVILAGDDAFLSTLAQALPQQVSDKVLDYVNMDPAAPEHEVLEATLDVMKQQDAKTDVEKVRRMFDEYRSGGLAVLGARDTLAALNIGQVDELLLSASLEQLYPEEEELDEPLAMTAGAGAAENGTSTRTVLLPDELVTKAAQTGAGVSFVEDASLLAGAGGVGAILRYRI